VKGSGAVTRREAALVGVAELYGGEEVERAEVEGVRGFRGSGSSSRAAPASRRRRRYGSAVAALLLAPPPPLLPPLLRLRVGGQGIGFPRAARVGEIQRRRRRLLIAAGRGGTWTAPMRREAAGARRDGAMTGASGFPLSTPAKEKGGEDDDADVGMTQGGGPTCQRHGAARGWWERGRCWLGRSGL
jgi:hypothetical protein